MVSHLVLFNMPCIRGSARWMHTMSLQAQFPHSSGHARIEVVGPWAPTDTLVQAVPEAVGCSIQLMCCVMVTQQKLYESDVTHMCDS